MKHSPKQFQMRLEQNSAEPNCIIFAINIKLNATIMFDNKCSWYFKENYFWKMISKTKEYTYL